ncbi:hypothetical protein [Nonomuraea zeae]|uniref:DUF5666 domain-containing protein n=1 Tax=Nonomuraea zeae TaxID=1642303 RepID=A0A5S4FKH7_9ACTN|nr:hypothetical protein [Nonomuraea zeae]TMR21238.1 hypothetical protein ETD85_51215 [Nonomuraea zeae]
MTKVFQHFKPHRNVFAVAVAGVAMTLTLSSAGAGLDAQAQATTWTVPMSGIATGTGEISGMVAQVGWSMVCKTVEAKVSARRGVGLPGDGIISITGISFAPVGATCIGPLGLTMDVSVDTLPLKFDATAFDARTGMVAGRVSGVSVTVESSDGCVVTVAGQADATYDNTSGAIVIADNSHLRIASVGPYCSSSGLKVGQNAVLNGRFEVAPRGVITSH